MKRSKFCIGRERFQLFRKSLFVFCFLIVFNVGWERHLNCVNCVCFQSLSFSLYFKLIKWIILLLFSIKAELFLYIWFVCLSAFFYYCYIFIVILILLFIFIKLLLYKSFLISPKSYSSKQYLVFFIFYFYSLFNICLTILRFFLHVFFFFNVALICIFNYLYERIYVFFSVLIIIMINPDTSSIFLSISRSFN